jgi:RimJ/RimL family protein N-acetyltransferase
MLNPYHVGERVYLRPLENADATQLQQWINDPDVTRYLSVYRPMKLEDEQQFIERANAGGESLAFGVALKSDDRLLGTAGLQRIDWKNRSAGFGISLGVPDEWGKGYGTEATRLVVQVAFERLNLHRVWLVVYEFNERGRRCYERAGFQQEGVMRDYHFADGRYWDAQLMAVLRPAWEAGDGRKNRR